MRRRDFITLLGGAAAAWPLAARAQQPALPVIGFLNASSPAAPTVSLRSFHQSLSDAGFVEGRNVAIEYRWAEGRYDQLPAMASDLVRRQVTVIVATGGIPAVAAAKAATSTIPIVCNVGVDPVRAGLVASLNRPGGNLTGVATLNTEVAPKRLQLLHEAVPAATAIALLVNPANQNAETLSADLAAAASALRLQSHVLRASTERDLAVLSETFAQLRLGALVIANDPFFSDRTAQLAALTVRNRLPAIYTIREFADDGGLMSYGPSYPEIYRQIGVYAGRVLKGEKPADLPVQQITRLDLVVNLKTAKAFGLAVPDNLLALADEIIE
jgi:ABC-type uncharacterized transport system substrate-binding protein